MSVSDSIALKEFVSPSPATKKLWLPLRRVPNSSSTSPPSLQLWDSSQKSLSGALRNIPTCPKEVIDDVDDLLVGELGMVVLPSTLLLAVADQRVRDVPDVLLEKRRWLSDTVLTQGWGNQPQKALPWVRGDNCSSEDTCRHLHPHPRASKPFRTLSKLL